VAAVPGSSFYRHPELGKRKIRFTFSKSDETLAMAAERLSKLNERLRGRRTAIAQG
jgi:aspartate/methionine/tyrosine aminotransferase